MSYKIILDSCGELPEQYKHDPRFESVPLSIQVGNEHIQDDETFNQAEFLKKLSACPECPKSSCPSPERYCEVYKADVDNVFVVTLSGQLSGSYNSAVLAKNLYIEQYGHKNIHVVDSESASGGETQIGLLAMELSEKGLPFETICDKLDAYRDNMNTYFILDNLETLRKNGRLTGVKALVASTLNIKPVMGADKGNIIQRSQTIGIKKGLKKLVELLLEECVDSMKKRVIITHVNAMERAERVKEMLMEKAQFLEILIMDTRGISTMYANDGGIIVTV